MDLEYSGQKKQSVDEQPKTTEAEIKNEKDTPKDLKIKNEEDDDDDDDLAEGETMKTAAQKKKEKKEREKQKKFAQKKAVSLYIYIIKLH